MRAREKDPELHTKKDCGRLEFPLSDWRGHRLGLDLEVSKSGMAWGSPTDGGIDP